MANKARWVFGVSRMAEAVSAWSVNVTVGDDKFTTNHDRKDVVLATLPRQDLRRACAHLGLSGAMERTNSEMVDDIINTVTRSTSWNGSPTMVPPFAGSTYGRQAVTATAPTVPSAPTAPSPTGSLEEIIRSVVRGEIATSLASWSSPIDEAKVTELIEDQVARLVQRPIVRNIAVNGVHVASVTGRRHFQYEDVLEHILLGDELYLWGGAGAGKTTVISQIASDLGKRFELVTFSSQTTEAKLVGFRDATGEVRETPLVSALQEPSVILFDEWDACPPSVALTVNAVSANRLISTPSGTYKVHPECVLVFSGNTSLDGATSAYNGRSATDFSSKDRLSVVEFLYDLDMERDLTIEAVGGDVVTADRWLKVVRAVRANVLAMGPTTSARIAITPRAALKGANLLRSGRFDIRYVANARLRKGMDDRTWDQARQGIAELV